MITFHYHETMYTNMESDASPSLVSHAGVGTGSFDMVSFFVRCLFNHEMVIHKYSIKMIGKTYSTTSPHTHGHLLSNFETMDN